MASRSYVVEFWGLSGLLKLIESVTNYKWLPPEGDEPHRLQLTRSDGRTTTVYPGQSTIAITEAEVRTA